MENSEVKMHSMISSVNSDVAGVSRAVEKTAVRYHFDKIKSVGEAISNASPSLIDAKKIMLAKDPTSTLVKDMLQLWIAKTCRSFNVPRNIDPTQIPIVADDIMEDFYYLKLSEIHFVLKRVRKGYHRKNYERIDVEIVYGWFEDYVGQDREPHFEQQNNLNHDAFAHDEKSRQYDDYVVGEHKSIQDERRRKMNNAAHKAYEAMNSSKKTFNGQRGQGK